MGNAAHTFPQVKIGRHENATRFLMGSYVKASDEPGLILRALWNAESSPELSDQIHYLEQLETLARVYRETLEGQLQEHDA